MEATMHLRLSSSSLHSIFGALENNARRRLLSASLVALTASITAPVSGQDQYPSRPITLVVGFAAGGAGDISSRFVAEYFRERWKVPVVVENRPGAGSTIAAGHIARAKPDGYTVGLVTISGYTIAPHFQPLPYHPEKDFTYLFQFLVGTEAMFVASSSPHRTAGDLIAWARANPGKMNWSTAATNGAAHVATAAAFQHLGISSTYVPYKGGADAMPALLGGQIDVLVAGGYTPFVRNGQVRLLAESGLQRIPTFPEVPTYKELGWPIGVPSFYGIGGPAGIPAAVVTRWEEGARAMVDDPKFKEVMGRLSTTGAFEDSKGFTNTLVRTYRDMGRLIPALGLKGN